MNITRRGDGGCGRIAAYVRLFLRPGGLCSLQDVRSRDTDADKAVGTRKDKQP